MYTITTIKNIDTKFITEWQDLWRKAQNSTIYNSYEWFKTSLETGQIKEYEILTCYKNRDLVFVLPLQEYTVFGVKVLGTINKEHLVDTAFLAEKYDKRLYKAVFTSLMKKNLYMQKVDENDVKILHGLYPSLFFSLISVNPLMEYTNGPFDTVSPSTNSQIQKIIRKNPGLHFEMYSENLDKHMKTMFKLHDVSSKKVRAMDIFEDSEVKKYYVALTKNFTSIMRICFLYLDKTPIAYQYGFMYRDIFAGDQIGYHNDYKKLRPGKTIIYFMAECFYKNNIRVLDQGGGISEYKMEFAKNFRSLYNLYYSPNVFIMVWFKSINKIRRFKQIRFPKKFTRDHEFLFTTL